MLQKYPQNDPAVLDAKGNNESACNIITCHEASCKSIWQKKQLGKQNNTQTCPTLQVIFWAESSQCSTPLFNRMAWQVEVPAGQVNFRGSLSHLASNVLKLMLHPVG